jgi:hypothetical protein
VRVWPWIGALLAVGLVAWLHRDFGATLDEGVQDGYGRLCLRYFASGLRDDAHARFMDLRFYGPPVEMLLALLQGPSRVSFTVRHLGLGVLSVLAIPALAAYARPLGRQAVGAYAVVALWVMPQFLGHAFNNSKDLPFLLGVAGTLAALVAVLVEPRLTTRRALWLGVSTGLALAVRPGGMLVLGAYGLLALALARVAGVGWPAGSLAAWRPALPRLGMAAVLAWALMVAFWPWAHGAPLARPLEAVATSLRFPHSGPVLFEGRYFESDAVPRRYLAEYLLIVTPLGHLLAAALAVPALVAGIRRRDRLATFGVSLALAWVLLPVLSFFAFRPTAYDGMRHFLFVLPGLALLAGFGLAQLDAWLRARLRRGRAAGIAVAALLLAPAAVVDCRLHPYESSAFNAFVGGLRGAADRYEVDSWASGLTEAATWVARHGRSRTGAPRMTVLLGMPTAFALESTQLAAGARAQVLPATDIERIAASGRGIDYYLGVRQWGMSRLFAAAPTVYAVQRDGVALVVVRDLGGAPLGGN